MIVLFHLISHAFFKRVLFINMNGMIFYSFINQSNKGTFSGISLILMTNNFFKNPLDTDYNGDNLSC